MAGRRRIRLKSARRHLPSSALYARLRVMMIRIFLAAMATSFAAFGLWSFLNPILMASGLGVEVGGPNGAYEMRGIYGGVSLGAAALAAAGAMRPAMTRPALWFLTAYLGGYVLARGAALALGPPPSPDFYAFIGFEVVCFALTLLALRANAGR